MKTQHAVLLGVAVGFGLGVGTIQGLRAQAKPAIYYIAEIDVSDVDGYLKEFGPKTEATIKAHGGKILAAGQNVTSIEGEPPTKRVAIQLWESMDKVQAWRSSAEFKEARTIGDKYAKFRAFTVEALPQ